MVRSAMRALAPLLTLALLGSPAIGTSGGVQSVEAEAAAAAPWRMVANPSLRGATGRIVVDVPIEASMIFHVLKPGSAERIDTWYGDKAGNLLPGSYDVQIWEKVIPGVPVERGKDTQVRVGVIDQTVAGIWELVDETGQRVYNDVGPKKVVLPVGTYVVKVGGGQQQIMIGESQVTAF